MIVATALLFVLASAQIPPFPANSALHPMCTIVTTFEQDCANLLYFLESEMGEFKPGPQGFNYNVMQVSAFDNILYIRANVTSPSRWFNYDMLVSLTIGENNCTMKGVSRSQAISLYDGYMNFCNIDVLVPSGMNTQGWTVEDCRWTPSNTAMCRGSG